MSEWFKKDAWDEALKECGLSAEWYNLRDRSLDECLPWNHLDCGVSLAYLKSEYRKAMQGEITRDFRKGCNNCGLLRYEGACR